VGVCDLHAVDVIQPVFKDVIDFTTELNGIRLPATDFYQQGNGISQFYMPVGIEEGRVTFDKITIIEASELDAHARNSELRELAFIKESFSELKSKAKWLIRNEIYFFIADKIVGKFMRARMECEHSRYYYIFKRASYSEILHRIRYLIGRFYRIRGERLGIRYKVKLYGWLKRLKEFMLKLGLKLEDAINHIHRKVKAKARARDEIYEEGGKFAAYLSLTRKVLPEEAYRDVAQVLALYFPQICGGSGLKEKETERERGEKIPGNSLSSRCRLNPG
jgi:hypothetical protein